MSEPKPIEVITDDVLKWEYSTIARSEVGWAASSLVLIRAADSLWERAVAANDLWRRSFKTNAGGTPANDSAPLSADELRVFEDHGIERVALMLLGFAIENVSKGLIVQADPSVVNDEDAQLRLKTHDLVNLAERAGIDLDASEQGHLQVVRDYLVWLGRYPVPLSAVGKGSPHSGSGAWMWDRRPAPDVVWTSSRAVLERLLNKRDVMFRVPAG